MKIQFKKRLTNTLHYQTRNLSCSNPHSICVESMKCVNLRLSHKSDPLCIHIAPSPPYNIPPWPLDELYID